MHFWSVISLITCVFANSLPWTPLNVTPEDILEGKLTTTDRRYVTFKIAMDIMRARGHKTLIETGTSRRGDKSCLADGCSTVIFTRWAEANPGMTLISVDNDEAAVREAKESIRNSNSSTIVQQDSVQFLKDFPNPIDFLYLDTMDFDPNFPKPSQQLPLREILAAFPKLHNGSVVLVDDCGLAFGGKCTFVELFLRENGWRTLLKTYQLVMVSNDTVLL